MGVDFGLIDDLARGYKNTPLSEQEYDVVNRYACDVLSEMRKCYKTYNFGCMCGLIEELQTMVNRMEAHLEDAKDAEYMQKANSRQRKENQKLLDQKEELLEEIQQLKDLKNTEDKGVC